MIRRQLPLLPTALLLLAAAGPVAAESTFDVVTGGEVQVQGGEQVCFTFDREDLREVQVRVRVRFTSWVPRGRVELDEIAGTAFREPSEEFVFWVDPRGVHRLKLVLEESATVDLLQVVTGSVRIQQGSCQLYEQRTQRRVEDQPPEPLNRLGRPEPSAPPAPPAPRYEEPPPSQPAPEPRLSNTDGGRLPTGTQLELNLESELDTRRSYTGQSFTARLSQAARADGRTVLPEGTLIRGRVIESKDAGRFGRSKLTLGFERAVLPDGREIAMAASLQRLGRGSAKKQGGIIAGSAIGGAVLGQVLGGDSESTMLGAALGGAIAAGSIAAKPGEPIVLPPNTILTVALDSPLEVPAR